MVRGTTSTRGLDAKIDDVLKRMPGADRQLALEQAGLFIKYTQLVAPRDTNRYANGWAEAGNDVGVPGSPFPVHPLKKSRIRGELIQRLEIQIQDLERVVEKFERIVASDRSRGRRDRWAREAERKLKVRQKRLDKAIEQLSRYLAVDDALIIFRKSKTGLRLTVRDKVYGGKGWIETPGGTVTLVRLHNREPHATIVEKRERVVARAKALVASYGGKAYGAKYVRTITARARLKT